MWLRGLIASGQMSSLKTAVNYLNLLKRAEGEEAGEVLNTCVGASSAFSSSTQLLSALGEVPCCLESRGLGSTAGSRRASAAILPGELLAGLYGGRLGVAFQHFLPSFLPASGNIRCLFFVVIESPPTSFALSIYLLCFKRIMEKVHGSTSLLFQLYV